MKITEIQVLRKAVTLNEPFKFALETITSLDTLIIKVICDNGLIGYGEASPFAQVTGETIESEQVALALFNQVLRGHDPLAIEAIHMAMEAALAGHTAAKAGIDMACYDLLGKQAHLPLYRLLGGTNPQITTDVTLGITTPQRAAEEAKMWVAQGFDQLKLKLGNGDANDLATVRAVSKAVGPNVAIRVDANQAWTYKQTLRMMKQIGDQVSVVEQPLPAKQVAELPMIRAQVQQALMVDESVHSPEDAFQILAASGADLINIKLQKSGGLFGAEQINAIAQSAGVGCMLGCMMETKIGLGAAAHFCAAHANVRYVDLDAFLTYQAPSWLHGGFTNVGGQLTLSEAPGLGIECDL